MFFPSLIGAVGPFVPPTDLDYPIPGSGTYRTAATALSGITYANLGTPYDPGGFIDTVANSTPGLRRYKYDGNFCTGATQTVGSYNLNFFSTATFFKAVDDTYVSWGNQSDGDQPGQHNFSIYWLGYVQVPTTQNYNIFVESDDTMAVWIGSAATGTFNAGNCSVSSSNKNLPGQAASSRNANSVTLSAGKWYPIRIWYSEFTGGCTCQFYMQGANGNKYNGSDLTWAYDSTTGGYNP